MLECYNQTIHCTPWQACKAWWPGPACVACQVMKPGTACAADTPSRLSNPPSREGNHPRVTLLRLKDILTIIRCRGGNVRTEGNSVMSPLERGSPPQPYTLAHPEVTNTVVRRHRQGGVRTCHHSHPHPHPHQGRVLLQQNTLIVRNFMIKMCTYINFLTQEYKTSRFNPGKDKITLQMKNMCNAQNILSLTSIISLVAT